MVRLGDEYLTGVSFGSILYLFPIGGKLFMSFRNFAGWFITPIIS